MIIVREVEACWLSSVCVQFSWLIVCARISSSFLFFSVQHCTVVYCEAVTWVVRRRLGESVTRRQ